LAIKMNSEKPSCSLDPFSVLLNIFYKIS
jgi:hypothetical protein